MRVLKFDDREAWLNARLGKITGSKLKDIVATRGARKIGSYQLVAESILGSAALAEEEAPMERGTRLEPEGIERYRKETGRKVDASLLLWISDDDPRIASSPDGVVGKTGAVECKCLSAARHIEAKLTGKIPKDYEPQARQYFVVNQALRWLDFIFYDPRFPVGLDFFVVRIERKDIEQDIAELLAYQQAEMKWVRDAVNYLTLYSPEEIAQAEKVRAELLPEPEIANDDDPLGPPMPVKITGPKHGKLAA
jgi:hypothetical protein